MTLKEGMGRKMTNKEEQDIQFYRGSAVNTVLKRYEFSGDEKKIIQAAIVLNH